MFGVVSRLYKTYQWLTLPQARRLRRLGIDYAAFQHFNLGWLKCLDIKVVVDVGANVGDYSAVIHEVLPDASIIAFEPLPDCYEQTRRRLSHIPKLIARNIAIGDTRGSVEFYRSSFAPSSSVLPMGDAHKLNFPFSSGHEKIQVECLPLDEALADVHMEGNLLVKIDVQGFEDRVIAGGQATLQRASVLWIEMSFTELYKGQSLFGDLYPQLRQLGLKYHGSHNQLHSPVDGSILQADCIFVRS